MSDKHADLLMSIGESSGSMTLVLPIHYKHLFNQFVQLDNTINLLKTRKTVPTFKSIKSTLEKTMKRQFTMGHFQ